MQIKFVYFDRVDSTNDTAFSLAEKGEPEGTVVCAETQTHGRGRGSNIWASPKNSGIYASFILRPDNRQFLYLVGLSLGLAVARVLKRQGLEIFLKWPNDILLYGKKAGGILTESRTLSRTFGTEIILVSGLGLNVNTLPQDIPPEATSLFIETGRRFDAHILLESISQEFFGIYEEFLQKQDLSPIVKEVESVLSTLGRHIEVEYKGRKIEGYALAVNEKAELLLRKETGEVLPLSVSFVKHLR